MGKTVIDSKIMDNVEILAKICLTKKEREEAMKNLQEILDYMAVLDELDTGDVSPMFDLYDQGNVFRDDVAEECPFMDEIVKGAPRFRDGQYMAPKTF